MGNAASIEPGGSELDASANVKVNRKNDSSAINPAVARYERKKREQSTGASRAGQQRVPSTPNFMDDVAAIANGDSSSPSGGYNQQQYVTNNGEAADDDDAAPVDVLLQFIPYYGQGDPANDSIVRATLNGLSIDEIDSKDEYGNTLLLLACQYRCEDLVRIMLGKGADPNAINSSGACCLHFACYRESASFNSARTLLQNGANPEVAEHTYGCTPLHYCAGTGEIEFCKLLLSNGAMISTRDYYNYTCVDYAREAGMQDVAAYLQARLDKFSSTQGMTRTQSGGNLMASVVGTPQSSCATDWTEYTDPISRAKYYIHQRSGETLWESDLRQRLLADSAARASPLPASPNRQVQASIAFSKSGKEDVDSDGEGDGVDMAAAEAWLATQTTRACLIGFLGKHDPQRLVEVENLIHSHKGKEELRAAGGGGGLSGGGSASAYGTPTKGGKAGLSLDFKLGASTPVADRGVNSVAGTPGVAGVPGGMDPQMVQNLVNEERLKYEAMLEEFKRESRLTVAAREGETAGLASELESLKRDKAALTEERANLIQKLDRASAKGGEAQKLIEEDLSKAQSDNIALKNDIAKLTKDLELNNSKISSLESSLRYSKEVKKLKTELQNQIKEHAAQERELRNTAEQIKQTADAELARVESSMREQKAKLTQELSEARGDAEDSKKFAAESCKRADAAEAIQRTMQAEQLARKRLHNEMEDMKGRIRVYVRVRPISKIGDANAKKTYDFDQVFGGKDGNTQKDVFRDTKHLIMSVVDGYNVCIFAYGQTGAGKSFTMIGASDIADCLKENELFRLLNERKAQVEFSVEVSMFQLYRDGLDDLLAEKRKPKNVMVDGAAIMKAESPTDMNAESSRSHLICTLVTKLKNRRTGVECIGKLTLVDLAGSERVDKSGAQGEVLKEAQSINKSLSALGDVISGLTSGSKHIPYRNHPLTMLMSDSLGGNAKTLMFVNTSPADYNAQETNSSLSFAIRCKNITNSVQQGPGSMKVIKLSEIVSDENKELYKITLRKNIFTSFSMPSLF
eukprot:GSChrysophyteH1.ASY1.ANO1.2666.1 assembled CDS